MTGDALSQPRCEFYATIRHDCRELRAVTTGATGEHQRRHRLFESFRRPPDDLVQLIVGNSERIGKLATVEPVSQLQIEHGTIVGAKTVGRLPYECRQFARFDGTGRTSLRRFEVGGEVHGIRGKGAGTAAGSGEAFVSGDGEQPCAYPIWLLQLREPLDCPDEHVLAYVGGIVGVAQQRLAEPVHGTTEAVVESGEGGSVTPSRPSCEIAVAHCDHTSDRRVEDSGRSAPSPARSATRRVPKRAQRTAAGPGAKTARRNAEPAQPVGAESSEERHAAGAEESAANGGGAPGAKQFSSASDGP